MKNMGAHDRFLRMSAAVLILLFSLNAGPAGTIQVMLIILSSILMLTSLFGICPLYFLFGIRTNKNGN